ncbi:MAG: response regulator [Rhodospirillales bacterium CG15_BIG_FIL_POST_REV_8_21_14_020_66_15]|nr:MAG: response regulator [Rhodospirillales bacterium CG15_BIG_FIL_POST_REV_8_21_14_020_66_15]
MPAVLVVDDNELARNLIAMPLAEVGFNVDTASGGNEALAKFKVRRHEVVITDILMADGEGIGLIRALLADDPDLPILAVSADPRTNETSSLSMAVKVGARQTLTKPFSVLDLLAVVGTLLSGEDETPRPQPA